MGPIVKDGMEERPENDSLSSLYNILLMLGKPKTRSSAVLTAAED